MITKKLFEKCFYDCQYEKACRGKTDVTVLVELYDKEYVIREYEDRGWELFDVEKELVNHGTKEVKADWQTGWHGERIKLVPAGSGSEAAYEDVVGSDGEWHRGKRLTVTVDDIREHWKMHFKRSESNYEKHKKNEEKMLKYASDIVKYDPSLKNDISPEEYVDEEVTRLERVYLDRHPAPGIGLSVALMVLGLLAIGFVSFLLFGIGVPDPDGTFKIVLIVASSVLGLGVLLLVLGIVLKKKHKKKMRAWIATQYDVEGKAKEKSKKQKEHCATIERVLQELY